MQWWMRYIQQKKIMHMIVVVIYWMFNIFTHSLQIVRALISGPSQFYVKVETNGGLIEDKFGVKH